MSHKLMFHVVGLPATQGSKHARPIYRGRGQAREFTGKVATVESCKRLPDWRRAVAWTAAQALRESGADRFTGPVEFIATYYLPRPKSHFRTGKHAGQLKPGAPSYVTTKPDLDKLNRAVFDGVTDSGAWSDDSQVTAEYTSKVYADPGVPVGVMVTIRPAIEAQP